MPVSLPDDNPSSRAALWTAHQASWWWRIVLLVGIASDVYDNLLLQTADLVSVAGLFWMLWATRRHGLVMCPRCAAEFPLDGPYQATRKATTLRWTHRLQTRRAFLVYLLALVATFALGVLLLAAHHTSAVLGGLSFYWICGYAAVQAHLLSVHRPLQPWCPWCHWDDGGDHEPAPRPVPPSGVGSP